MTGRLIHLDTLSAEEAAALPRALAAASLVCFPTDTVYGLGGDCRPEVVAALLAAKGRSADKPLQLIFPSLPALLEYLAPPLRLARALERLLPGALTLVVPAPPGHDVPPPGRAADGRPTLGVRVPAWPPPARALAALAGPLVGSSANAAGASPPRRVDELPAPLRAACDLLLDAGPLPGTASTVVDLTDLVSHGRWRILRPGAVSAGALAEALGGPSPG